MAVDGLASLVLHYGTKQVPDNDALILSFWLFGLAPSSLGLQELNFPGTGLSITRGR